MATGFRMQTTLLAVSLLFLAGMPGHAQPGAAKSRSATRSTIALGEVQSVAASRTGQTLVQAGDQGAEQAICQAVDAMLTRQLTREEAIQIALLNNRNLQATLATLGIANADLVEAGLLKNPVFEGIFRDPEKSGRINAELSVAVDFVQILTLPLRRKVAASRFEKTKLDVSAKVLDLAFDVQSAFYELQAAEQLAEMYRTTVEATRDSFEAAQRIHQAGNIPDLELHLEQAIYEEAKLELAAAQTEGVNLRERLNLLMGLWGPCTQWKIASRLPRPASREIELRGLESLAVCQRMDLAAARQEIETVGRELGITQATALIPELEIGLNGERESETGDWARGPQIAFPIPLFNQGQGRIARGRAELCQAQHRYYALAVEVRADVRQARSRMMSARERVHYYEKIMIPLRTRIVEDMQLQYNAMEADVFRLLETKRQQVQAGRETIEALRDYWVARSELEHALGGCLQLRQSHGTWAQGSSSAEGSFSAAASAAKNRQSGSASLSRSAPSSGTGGEGGGGSGGSGAGSAAPAGAMLREAVQSRSFARITQPSENHTSTVVTVVHYSRGGRS